RHRVLPAYAADDHAQRLGRTPEVRGRILGDIGREGNHDLVDRRMREKRLHTPLEQRSPIERQQLLGTRVPEPLAASARGNARRHVHWGEFCSLSTASATIAWTRSASALASCVVGAAIAGG